MSIFILFGLLCSALKNTEDNNARNGVKSISEAAESTSIVISPEVIDTEEKTAKRLKDEIKAKRKALNKAHIEAIKKFKEEVKAKRKTRNKAHRKAAKKLKGEGKAQRKALAKAQQDTAKRVRGEEDAKRKGLDKAYQEAIKALRDEETAKKGSRQGTAGVCKEVQG